MLVRIYIYVLSNAESYFLAPNTTSVIQPCDQGIIQSFKVHYRKLLVEYFLEKVEKGEEYTSLTVSNSIKFINKAWRKVSSTTIVNC